MNDDWSPGFKYQLYLNRIQELLTKEKRTVRDVYYALESYGFEQTLGNHGYDFEYRYVKRAVKKGRRHGYIDPSLIIDESRRAETTVDPGHESAESFVDNHIRKIWRAYEENLWNNQDLYLEIWLEKQSLASVFRPITKKYNVRLEATRGDWSDSKVYEAAKRITEKIKEGRDVRVMYFGDFNPSGYHAPVSVQETMGYYGLPLTFRTNKDDDDKHDYFDIWPVANPVEYREYDGTLGFERKGINLEHIKKFNLPENPNPSKTDKDRKLRERFQQQVTEGRDVNVELNALKEYHRDYLEDLIEDSITEYIDDEKREEIEEREEQQKEIIQNAVNIDEGAFE